MDFYQEIPTKWKAEAALEVFKKGGKISEYWKKAKERKPQKKMPYRVIALLEERLLEIEHLNPTCEEIVEYAKAREKYYGVVTCSYTNGYFAPKLHDTWGLKTGGRVHIDLGYGGYHIMSDKHYAKDFIEFIKKKRIS